MTTDAEKLKCAIEAIAAMGNTGRAIKWFRDYEPEYLDRWGVTSSKYSLSCCLMDHAHKLLTGEKLPFDISYRHVEHERDGEKYYEIVFD